jgi:hypothetical protein
VITNVSAGHGMNSVTVHLMTVIVVYALVVFACRRQWIKPNEIALIGGADIFWTIAWVLSPLIPVVRTRFPELSTAIPASLGMIAPLIAAMIFGLIYVKKKVMALNSNPPEPKQMPTSKRKSKKA